MTSTTIDRPALVTDPRAQQALVDASADVASAWQQVTTMTAGELPGMGLAAGEQPTADVEVLAGVFAAVEYELARRMHAADASGSLPLQGPGALLAARGWALGPARRLARCGQLAAEHPAVAGAWAAGVITAEHVEAIARHAGPLSTSELAAVIAELADHWGSWSPAAIARFVAAAARLLHPPAQDPSPDEKAAYDTRDLSFALYGDAILMSATLPRLEGEAVIAAIDAWAQKLRSTAEHTPAGARRADALVELVNQAAANGTLPSRGGLPVALTVTLDHTSAGDPIWTTSRGHPLSTSEVTYVACDPSLTPVARAEPPDSRGPAAESAVPEPTPTARPPGLGDEPQPPDVATRLAALAELMLGDARLPLAVGRSTRIATPAQRRALASRDGGCIIPGCTIPAENCQTHHVEPWALGADTDIDNLVLLCWTHHRQVDLGSWTIHRRPPDLPVDTWPATSEPDTPGPERGPGAPWPANNGAPWTIRRTPRHRWSTSALR